MCLQAPGIPEETSPKSVLKRQSNDLPLTKESSGHRSSPRVNSSDTEQSPAESPAKAASKSPAKASPAKTPRVRTPKHGSTPVMSTPCDAVFQSPSDDELAACTPVVFTPASKPNIKTPRDLILESPSSPAKSPAKAEASSKKVKTPRSVLKRSVARTPRTGKKTLWSEVVKKNLAKSNKKVKPPTVPTKSKVVKKATAIVVKSPSKEKTKKALTLGHANSPAPIVISKAKVVGIKKVDVKKSSKQTPKVAPKVVKSAKKTPSNALKKTGKTPIVLKSVKRTLYADILKKNLGKTPKKSQAASKASGVVTKNLVKKDVKRLQTPKNKKIKSVLSTGHVNSPASIVITKKKTPKKSATEETPKKAPNKKETPKITPKKGTPLAKKGTPKRTSIMDEIPSNTPPNIVVTTPSSKKSSEKRYPLNMSAVETHARLGSASSAKKPRRQTIGSPMATPKNRMLERVKRGTPASEKGRRRNSFRESPSAALLSQSLNSDSPGDLNATNFDFDAMETPPVPVELLVSPMAGASGKGKELYLVSNQPVPLQSINNNYILLLTI